MGSNIALVTLPELMTLTRLSQHHVEQALHALRRRHLIRRPPGMSGGAWQLSNVVSNRAPQLPENPPVDSAWELPETGQTGSQEIPARNPSENLRAWQPLDPTLGVSSTLSGKDQDLEEPILFPLHAYVSSPGRVNDTPKVGVDDPRVRTWWEAFALTLPMHTPLSFLWSLLQCTLRVAGWQWQFEYPSHSHLVASTPDGVRVAVATTESFSRSQKNPRLRQERERVVVALNLLPADVRILVVRNATPRTDWVKGEETLIDDIWSFGEVHAQEYLTMMREQGQMDVEMRGDDRLLIQLNTWESEVLQLLRYLVSSRAWWEHGHSEHLVFDNVIARLVDWEEEEPTTDPMERVIPRPVRDLHTLWKFGEAWEPEPWDERD